MSRGGQIVADVMWGTYAIAYAWRAAYHGEGSGGHRTGR